MYRLPQTSSSLSPSSSCLEMQMKDLKLSSSSTVAHTKASYKHHHPTSTKDELALSSTSSKLEDFFRNKYSKMNNNTRQHDVVTVAATKSKIVDKSIKEERSRSDMMKRLETRLRHQCTTNSRQQQHNEIMIAKSAKILEKLLYSSSMGNLDIYNDSTTLDERIRVLLTVKLQRRLQITTKNNRSKLLQQLLGLKRYSHVRTLLNQIKIEKTKIIANQTRSCCSGSSCIIMSTSDNTVSAAMPSEVRMLFFDRSLSDAFERVPINTIHKIDWDILIAKGENTLRILCEWSSSQNI